MSALTEGVPGHQGASPATAAEHPASGSPLSVSALTEEGSAGPAPVAPSSVSALTERDERIGSAGFRVRVPRPASLSVSALDVGRARRLNRSEPGGTHSPARPQRTAHRRISVTGPVPRSQPASSSSVPAHPGSDGGPPCGAANPADALEAEPLRSGGGFQSPPRGRRPVLTAAHPTGRLPSLPNEPGMAVIR